MHGLSPFPTFILLIGCVNWKSLPKNAAVYVWYIHKPWMVILYWKNTIKTIGAKIEKELKHVFLSCASSASKFMQQCPFLWDSCAYSFHWREAPSLWNPRWTLALILKSVSRRSVWVCLCVTAANIIDFTPCFQQVTDPHACTMCMFALCKIHWSSSAILLSINTVLVIRVIIYRCSTES